MKKEAPMAIKLIIFILAVSVLVLSPKGLLYLGFLVFLIDKNRKKIKALFCQKITR